MRVNKWKFSMSVIMRLLARRLVWAFKKASVIVYVYVGFNRNVIFC